MRGYGIKAILSKRTLPSIRNFAKAAGATATIQNIPPLVTSNKTRRKYGLPERANANGSPARVNDFETGFLILFVLAILDER